MKETAVFDKPYVKKSAWTVVEDLPKGALRTEWLFSSRVLCFSDREELWHG